MAISVIPDKISVDHIDDPTTDSFKQDVIDFKIDDDLTKEEQKRVLRRVDLRVTVTCGLMFCISLMDRTNMGSAAIAGYAISLKKQRIFKHSD